MNDREAVVVGVHATEQAKRIDRPSIDVCWEAVLGALDDAGLSPADVDGVGVRWPGPGGLADDCASWGRFLGSGPLHWTVDGHGGTGGIRSLASSAAAIRSGLCDTVVVGGGRAGVDKERRTLQQFSEPWGAWGVTVYALIARRHMYQFGTKPEHIAKVAATIRNHGHANPEAVMYDRGPYTIDDVLASPMVASPFHLLELSIFAQGGAAMVLTTLERARDLRQPPIALLGAGYEIHQANYVNPPLYDEVGRIGETTAERVLGTAGVRPEDIDVFCLYDPNAFEVIRQFEILGLCKEGEGGPFVEDNDLSINGNYPTNPDGGLLSYAWCHMQTQTLKVIESVKQLRGQAGARQVDDASLAVAANAGAGSHHWEMALLGRA
jgi:acetyl-CoA acetyltransferase